MSKPQQDGSRQKSKRRLTVTYYVEPQDLRHLSIPVRRANAVLITAALSVVWTIGSLLYLGVDVVRRLGLRSRALPEPVAESTADTSGGEEVGFSSAPVATPSVAEPAPNEPVTVPRVAMATEPEKPEAPRAQEPAAEAPKLATLPEDPPAVPAPATEETPSETEAETASEPAPTPVPTASHPSTPAAALPKLSIENSRIAMSDEHLSAHVEIVNTGKRMIAGRVWGVATYTTADGKSILVASHNGIDTASPESEGHAGATYKALRMSVKELRFAVPKDAGGGRFSEVKLIVSETRAKAPLVMSLPVAP